MDYRKPEMKFLKTNNAETADKLRYCGFTQMSGDDSGTFVFLNDGKKLAFDAEQFGAVYTNILTI